MEHLVKEYADRDVQFTEVPHPSSKATARVGPPWAPRRRSGNPMNVKRFPTT